MPHASRIRPVLFFSTLQRARASHVLWITTDRRPRCAKDRGRVQNQGPANAPRFAPAVTGPAAFTRPSEADAYSFYPRSSNYGLALESHPQARQASSHVARLCPGRRGGEPREPRWTQGTWPRLVPATRRVTEAGPHMQMSASTSRSVTVSWPGFPFPTGPA